MQSTKQEGARRQYWKPSRVDSAPHDLNERSGIGGTSRTSVRQRIGPHLDFEDLWISLDAAFTMEVRAGAGSGPDAAAFPARFRIVDTAVDVLGEEALRIGHSQINEFALHQRRQRLASIGLGDRHVSAEAENVIAVDPDVIRMVGAALGIHAF